MRFFFTGGNHRPGGLWPSEGPVLRAQGLPALPSCRSHTACRALAALETFQPCLRFVTKLFCGVKSELAVRNFLAMRCQGPECTPYWGWLQGRAWSVLRQPRVALFFCDLGRGSWTCGGKVSVRANPQPVGGALS